MGITKQKLARLKILDSLLSNRYHNYSMEDLTEEISRRMAEMDSSSDGVVVRTVQKDVKFLRDEWPEFVDIEEYTVPATSRKTQKTYLKHCLRYAKRGFSIFTQKLSNDERYLLSEAISLLGQFDGLPNLDALENFRLKMGVHESDRKIISFTKNPIEGTNVLGKLFTAISHRQVVELTYHRFGQETHSINVSPYLLKEYNRRWYIFASAESDGKLLNFALDRIDDVKPLPSNHYEEYDGDINERSEDIIGVTYFDESPVYKIYFWVSDKSKDYIMTKPLHESQRNIRGDKEHDLREKYPSLAGGVFFRIDCKYNYELIRELTSFGAELIVLEPSDIVEKIQKRINSMYAVYNTTNKGDSSL